MKKAIYAIGRGANGRPTLMHRVHGGTRQPVCGLYFPVWNREYTATAWKALLCKRCKRMEEKGLV